MNDPIFYVTADPERAIGLESLIPDFHIVCQDRNYISDVIRARNGNIISLESELDQVNPQFRNSNKLLNHPIIQDYINENRTSNSSLIFFKIAPNLEVSAKNMGLKVLNTSAALNRHFELKVSQFHFLSGIEVRIPDGVTGLLEQFSYDEMASRFGSPFVIQFDRGHTGKGTHFINNSDEFALLADTQGKRKVKISEFIDGEAWTLNGVCTRLGTFYGGLSFQITGLKPLTNMPGATVGNDWSRSSSLAPEQINQIAQITERVGDSMYKGGFEGLFGLDLIVDRKGDVYLIEINARQPASTGMHSQLMLLNKQIPLKLLHIAQFLTVTDQEMSEYVSKVLGLNITPEELKALLQSQNNHLMVGYNASQVILRNESSVEVQIREDLLSGVYSDQESPQLVDTRTYRVDQINSNQMLLLGAGIGRAVSAGSEIARVQMHSSALDGTKLKSSVEEIIMKVKEKVS